MSKAIYAGSFDPFTFGHLDICKKASTLFEKLYIVIGANTQKKHMFDIQIMKTAIEKDLCDSNIENCEVIVFDGLIAHLAENLNAQYLVRGLRNNMDYNYEENIAEINKLINPNLDSIYFRANNKAVSSSMVKELYIYGQNLSKYIPYNVLKAITND